MLNFKFGEFYKDTDGEKWRFCGYYPNDYCPYTFINKEGFILKSLEKPDNLVTEYPDGNGVKIPFVEKERDWVIGEEYECFDAVTQRVIKARLTKIIEKTDSHLVFVFHINGLHFDFHFEGIVLVAGRYVVFKDGVPQELKDRINKGKLTNKRKCFQAGRIYKNEFGMEFKFRKRMKTKIGVLAIFEMKNGDIISYKLFRLNNVECIPNHNTSNVYMCADESIRGESSNKAVRVMQ